MLKKLLIVSMVAMVILGIVSIVSAEEAVTSLTLDEAITYAESNSLQLKAATQDLAEAKAKVREAGSIFWPTFEATLAGTKPLENSGSSPSAMDQAILNELIQNDSDNSFRSSLGSLSNESPDWISTTNASLSQLIFSAPAFQQYKIAKRSYSHSMVSFAQTKEDLAFNITSLFITVCKAKEGIRIAEESLVLAEKNLKMTKAFFEAGLNVKTDVLKMELAVSNTRQALLSAENGFQTALAGLKQALGYPQDKALEIVVPQALPVTVLPEATSSYSARYDWQLAQIRREMAEIGVKLSRSGYLPSARISYDYKDTEYDKFAPGDGDTSLTVGVQWSFSFGGKVHAQVKQAEASLNKAKIYCESVNQIAAMEILQARLGYVETQKRMEIAALSLKIAEENSHLAVKRYEAGVGTTLEVSDAQVALEQAKYNELSARYDHYISGLKLEKALGIYRRTLNEGSGK